MKNACSRASEDETVDKEESFEHVLPNGNKPIDNEKIPNSKEYSDNNTQLIDAAANKESCSDDNDEHEIVVLKEEENVKALKESRNCQPPVSKPGRRSSRLQGKRPKMTEIITTSDEEENLESDEELPEKVIQTKRRRSLCLTQQSKDKALPPSTKNPDFKPNLKESAKEKKSKKDSGASKLPKEFSSGSFVVIKSDFHSTTTPAIWRIDGKALLQKYVHFDQDGQILYKNTSTYSGWTLSNRDQYYPAEVEIKSQKRNETIVKFKKELIIADDSD